MTGERPRATRERVEYRREPAGAHDWHTISRPLGVWPRREGERVGDTQAMNVPGGVVLASLTAEDEDGQLSRVLGDFLPGLVVAHRWEATGDNWAIQGAPTCLRPRVELRYCTCKLTKAPLGAEEGWVCADQPLPIPDADPEGTAALARLGKLIVERGRR